MEKITVVTTPGRPDEQSTLLAKIACEELNIPFVPRNKKSIAKMSDELQANIIVAGKNRYEYYPLGTKEPFFFHPNSAAFRLKRVARGEQDPFIEACNLVPGDKYLDCTLGIGSDAMLASFIVGEDGIVVGLEADSNVAFIVGKGMQTYDLSENPYIDCMRQIKVIHREAIEFLREQEDCSYDVVYMDPMFEEVIKESTNFEPLRHAGSHLELTAQWVAEATRVAKKRVVLKAHYQSPLFDQFNFKREIRLTSKFHYGIIEKV